MNFIIDCFTLVAISFIATDIGLVGIVGMWFGLVFFISIFGLIIIEIIYCILVVFIGVVVVLFILFL